MIMFTTIALDLVLNERDLSGCIITMYRSSIDNIEKVSQFVTLLIFD
jgi:hypothetical protein